MSQSQAMRTVSEQTLSNATPQATHTLVRILLIMQLQMSFTHWSRYRWLITRILLTENGKRIVIRTCEGRGSAPFVCNPGTKEKRMIRIKI